MAGSASAEAAASTDAPCTRAKTKRVSQCLGREPRSEDGRPAPRTMVSCSATRARSLIWQHVRCSARRSNFSRGCSAARIYLPANGCLPLCRTSSTLYGSQHTERVGSPHVGSPHINPRVLRVRGVVRGSESDGSCAYRVPWYLLSSQLALDRRALRRAWLALYSSPVHGLIYQ